MAHSYSPINIYFLLWALAASATALANTTVSSDKYTGDQTLVVQYPDIQDQYQRDFDPYFLALIELALKKTKVAYRLEPVPLPVMIERRSANYLSQNPLMVHWLNASVPQNPSLVPIEIPLFKGLIGWRVFFIREENQPAFAKVKSLKELTQFRAGQGLDWPDTQILKDNQLDVITSPSWRGLFEMLLMGRIDYFPRSIIEIEREKRLFSSLNLHVEKTIVLQYPAAYYFYVNRQNIPLLYALNIGLSKAMADGDFDKLFHQYFDGIIESSQLKNRQIIKLNNPRHFPVNEPTYWYSPINQLPL